MPQRRQRIGLGLTLANNRGGSTGGLAPPGTPTIGTATTTGATTATVSFTPGSPAGTNYRAISTPGGLTGNSASSPITVTGLTTGVDYTFTVRAENAAGNSTESAASNTIKAGYGPELISNGGFTTDTAWTKGSGWAILGGIAEFTAGAGGADISQPFAHTSSVNYEVTYTVLNWAAGSTTAKLIGGTTVSGTARGANGTYTEVLTAPASLATFAIGGSSGGNVDIDNVSARRKF